MRLRFATQVLIILAAALLLGCGMPRDQRGTLERVSGEKKIRVGLIESPPWVVRGPADTPLGSEVELVNRFGTEIDAIVETYWVTEPDAMEALKRTQLDLVVGGLTESTLWKNEVGLTRSYFTDRIVVGVPAWAELPENIDAKSVFVAYDDPHTRALVSEEKALVRHGGQDVAEATAARDWRLEQIGFKLTEIELRKDEHVIAVAPGENAFLVRLETFLKSQRPGIKEMLQRQSTEATK